MKSNILEAIFVISSLSLCLGILIEENDHQDIVALKQDVQQLQTQCRTTDQDLRQLKSELAQLKTNSHSAQSELEQLRTKVQVLETVMAQPSVAFMAELGKDIDNPAAGRQIVFDEVHLNKGNAYNNVHGTFIAPMNGTYHFSLELSFPPSSDHNNKKTHVYLKQKTRAIGYIYGDGTQTDWIKRTVTALVDLVVGDDVYAFVHSILGDHKIAGCCMHSTFSGFLVQQ